MACDEFQRAGGISADAYIDFQFSDQLRATFDPEVGALWLRWNPLPRPCFNPQLLAACKKYCDFLQDNKGMVQQSESSHAVEFSVLGSDVPGVFNLGGDLNLFTKLIDERDQLGLAEYGMACVEVVYRNYVSYELPLTTVSLVEGECLGGGFEAALSSQVVIAERRARFGFPEILFNLFPGMGAVSFVLRRADKKTAEELTHSGKIYSAEELFRMGIIDMVVNDGEGSKAVRQYLRTTGRRLRPLFEMRRRVARLTREELADIVDLWVDAALRLTRRDLRLMGHIVARQDKLH